MPDAPQQCDTKCSCVLILLITAASCREHRALFRSSVFWLEVLFATWSMSPVFRPTVPPSQWTHSGAFIGGGNDLPLSNHCGRARRHTHRRLTSTCIPACQLPLVEAEKCTEKAKRTIKRAQVNVRVRRLFFVDFGKLWRTTSVFFHRLEISLR